MGPTMYRTTETIADPDLYQHVLRQADDTMILCQRLCQWVVNAPSLEEDIALANIGLDLIGKSRSLYAYAANLTGTELSEDDLVFMRNERDWVNCRLVERPNGDFADTIARQAFFDIWHREVLAVQVESADETLAAVAGKSLKEATYHVRHSSEWVRRLGDGTELSASRMQRAVDDCWPDVYELFEMDDLAKKMLARGVGPDLETISNKWFEQVDELLSQAKLRRPADVFAATGGRSGMHTEHMGYLLAEMQVLPRSMPGCTW